MIICIHGVNLIAFTAGLHFDFVTIYVTIHL